MGAIQQALSGAANAAIGVAGTIKAKEMVDEQRKQSEATKELTQGQKDQIKLQSVNTALEVNKLEGEQIRTSEAIDNNKGQIKDLNYRIKLMKQGYVLNSENKPEPAKEGEDLSGQIKELKKQKKIANKVVGNLKKNYDITSNQINVMKQIIKDVGGEL